MADVRNVIVELSYRRGMRSLARSATAAGGFAMTATAAAAVLPPLPGIELDTGFAPVEVPKLIPIAEPAEGAEIGLAFALSTRSAESSYIVRGRMRDGDAAAIVAEAASRGATARIYADPTIAPLPLCGESAPKGTDADVEGLLCASELRANGMTGKGVYVAIVDTGLNLAYLRSHGKRPRFNKSKSWVFDAQFTPGQMVVDHGTMCAYAVCIAAPRCTLLDVAVLRSVTLEALLSDAIRAYSHLLSFMRTPLAAGKTRSLVVNNSWGVYNLDSDFPPGDPGNYTENPAHPFNVIVASLERAGADIVFAAGNCGRDCPDGRCSGVTRMIHGANAHAQTLCVAGVDVDKLRVGYSSIGPGRLERLKPDLAGYTHFAGSQVFAPDADSGTSTAAPVVAGVVAALRSRFPRDPAQPATSPAAIRALLTKTAEDRGTVGFDFRYGWGIVNGCRIAALQSLNVPEPPDA